MTLDTVWRGMMCKQLINLQLNSSLLDDSFFYQMPQIGQNVPYFGVSVGCLEGVWDVSRDSLGDSGYFVGGYGVNSIEKHQIWIILISCDIFSQWSFLGNCWPKMQNFRSDVEG